MPVLQAVEPHAIESPEGFERVIKFVLPDGATIAVVHLPERTAIGATGAALIDGLESLRERVDVLLALPHGYRIEILRVRGS